MAEDFTDGVWREQTDEQRLEEEIEFKQAQQQRAIEQQARMEEIRSRLTETRNRIAHASFEAERRADEVQRDLEEFQNLLIEGAVRWLEEKWGPHRECPYCGNAGWSVSTPFNVLLESRETLSPHFAAMCTNCGNTVFINAIMAGLFPEPGEAQP